MSESCHLYGCILCTIVNSASWLYFSDVGMLRCILEPLDRAGLVYFRRRLNIRGGNVLPLNWLIMLMLLVIRLISQLLILLLFHNFQKLYKQDLKFVHPV